MADVRLMARTSVLSPSAEGQFSAAAMDRLGNLFTADMAGLVARAAAAGRFVVASDADQNDLVTGQTSFANTTPTFLLNVPSGSLAVPVFVHLFQSGTVAGGAVDVIIEADDIAAYASGGTAETQFYFRNGAGFTTACAVYSGATATGGYGVRLAGYTLGQDVSPAEGAVNQILWQPTYPMPLVGPASLKVFTYAGTTGPTWFWSLAYIDMPASWLTS